MVKNILLFFLVAAVAPIYVPEVHAQGCAQKIISKCQEGGKAAWNPSGAKLGSGMHGGTSSLGSDLNTQGAEMGKASGACRDMKKECAKCPQAERQQCEQGLNSAASQMDAQSAGMGDAGAAMGAIAGMLGALLPALMQQKDDDEEKKNDSALLPNGQIDCSKQDAYMFAPCNDLLSASCRNAMEDPRCVAFSNRFCAAEGAGSSFCGFVTSYGFCRAGGRDNCPSCLQLQRESSAACQTNPALCLAQNSPDAWAQYQNTCPGDPMFAGGGGAPVALPPNGGGVAPPVVGGGNGNLPTVVLPGGGGNNPPVVNPGGPNPGAPVPPPLNNGGGGGTAIASREGHNANGQAGAAGSGGVSTFSIASAQGQGGAIREGQSGRNVANSGPASDVQGQYGPSLFATSTQVIRNRCAQGKFLNCP